MLLNRKFINRLAKWFAVAFAVIFALSITFVSGKTGNIFQGCSSSTSSSSQSNIGDQEAYYQKLIKQNPKDKESVLALAGLYEENDVARYQDAVTLINNYLKVVPNDTDVRVSLSNAYIAMNDPKSAMSVLTDATKLAPQDPNLFLQLGMAAKKAGDNQAAIAAWNTFLQLAPNDPNAPTVKSEITTLSSEPAQAPTTPAPGTGAAPAP